MEEQFLQATISIRQKKLDNNELLSVYGLYKQATIGDNNTSRPGIFDLKGKAKWDAWESKRGMSTLEAKKTYIEFVANHQNSG